MARWNTSPRGASPRAGGRWVAILVLGVIVREARQRYPRLQVAYLSSRSYGGYAMRGMDMPASASVPNRTLSAIPDW